MGADADFDAFVSEYGGVLIRFAFLLCHDRGRAEDLTQEALLRSYQRWRRSEPPQNKLAYVRRALTREYLGWRRRLPSRELVVADHDAGRPQPSGEAVFADREALWRLMSQLPLRQRAVLVLRYYEDRDDREIAEILGCARATVRSLAARALTTLRERVDSRTLLDSEVDR